MDDFGAIIKEYRIKRKMSQNELADKIGTTKQVISHYERGERIPKISAAKKISDALGIPLAVLAGVEEKPVAPPTPKEQLLALVKNVPEEKAEQLLRIMKAILSDAE